MKEILIKLSEEDKFTERISFEEYLRLTRLSKFPALLIDIFKYLGAKRYVSYVLEPEPTQSLNRTADSDVSGILIKRNPTLKAIYTKVENDLTKWKTLLGSQKVEEFWKAFRKIAVNPMKSEIEIIATIESIRANFKSVFGVENEFFATVFYYYLSGGYHQKEIKLPDFISKFLGFNTLLKKDLYNFSISFLDANRDGQVTLIDLIYFLYSFTQKHSIWRRDFKCNRIIYSKANI